MEVRHVAEKVDAMLLTDVAREGVEILKTWTQDIIVICTPDRIIYWCSFFSYISYFIAHLYLSVLDGEATFASQE